MATIRDVAKESGVSVATVSYVLNNGPRPVRSQTRERVLAAMRRLNYHPNAMARGLVRRRMNTVGVLFGQIESTIVTNAYATAVLEGILSAAAALGYNVTLFPQPWISARHSAGQFRDRRTDGAIIIAPQEDSDIVPSLAALGLPLVVVSSPSQRYGVPCFDVDNRLGAQLATEHLLEKGHRRIALVGGSARFASAPTRRAGYLSALNTAGIVPVEDYLQEADYSGYGAVECLNRLLALPSPPTAIFAGNDIIAMRLVESIFERGLSVPQHLSVVGFDDVPLAALVRPPLTTIRQPLNEMGSKALRLLVERIEGAPLPDDSSEMLHTSLPHLVERKTTAAPCGK